MVQIILLCLISLALYKGEGNLLVGQFAVNRGIGGSPSLYVGLILGAEHNLKKLASINLAPGSLSLDLGGVYDVIEDGLVNGSQGTTARSESGALGTSGEVLAQDSALGNDQYVGSREFLLEFTYKLLLDGVEGLLKLEGDVEDDCLASSSTVNLLGGGDVKPTKGSFELSRGRLETEEFLSYRQFEIIGFL